jgi:hypothetical protein
MPRRAVILFGAGFSRCAGGPLLRELLDPAWVKRSAAATGLLEALRGELGRARVRGPDSADLEGLFTKVWQEARTGGSIELGGERIEAEAALHQLTIHLSSLAANITLRGNSGTARAVQRYLSDWAEKYENLTLVTFNYDLLLENMLDLADLSFDEGGNVDFAFDDSDRERAVRRRGSDVTLLKLHGSASWGLCRGCRRAEVGPDVVSIFERPWIPERRRRCPFCDESFLDPGIIPPIAGKAGELAFMLPVWRDARRAVGRAQRLEIVGYSLPATDAEAASLLREAKGLSKGGAITAVCGPSGASGRIREIFPALVDHRARFEDFLQVHYAR